MNNKKGFTLLELLLVLTLMAFLFSTVKLPDLSQEPYDLVEQETKRIATLIDLASEYAILNNVILGFAVTDSQYGFLYFDGKNWLEIAIPPFVKRDLDENLIVSIVLDGLEWQENNLLNSIKWIDEEELEQAAQEEEQEDKLTFPQVFILPSGEISSFELDVAYDNGFDDEIVFKIRGEFTSPVRWFDPIAIEDL